SVIHYLTALCEPQTRLLSCITAPHPHTTTLFYYSYAPHPAPHSFPTRRSSDLALRLRFLRIPPLMTSIASNRERVSSARYCFSRSEEHTSELQSRFDLVCSLLLEKKNSIHLKK